MMHDRMNWQAWNMKGFVWRRLQKPDPDGKAAWQSSLEFREQAAGLAWRDPLPGRMARAVTRRAAEGGRDPVANLAVALAALGARGCRRWRPDPAAGDPPVASGEPLLRAREDIAGAGGEISRRGAGSIPKCPASGRDKRRARYHAYIAEASALIATSIAERVSRISSPAESRSIVMRPCRPLTGRLLRRRSPTSNTRETGWCGQGIGRRKSPCS